MTRPPAAPPPPDVLQAFALQPESCEPAPTGLINRTWYARGIHGGRFVLQQLHSIFPAEINDDIAAVTAHVAAKGLVTPRLVRAAGGQWWHRDAAGGVWRALTYVDGVTRHAVGSMEQAREAGRILAEFHRAVADLRYQFKNARLGVHDTPRHLHALRTALKECTEHREHAAVAPLAERVLGLAANLPALPVAGDRIVHGDPKISNVVFAQDSDHAICLVDLDTLARMPVALELGDALRSWCNPVAEDARTAGFSLPLFTAAVEGYAAASAGFLTPAEWGAIPAATLTICVELAARFCTDSLRERYFGWDEQRYPSASAHNQARTRNQLQVADNVLAALPAMHTVTNGAFRG
jgi:Ser/Thr protein kinase RdoA (MazF antagonist)